MKELKIGLYNCPKSTTYKLIRLTSTYDLEDPCLLWVFDSSKLKLAQKIMNNMNIANAQHTGFAYS